ncbi:MAG: cysteine desulfurase family protein [Thermodesulfobacteriota bacterium]|nr:cysteine desulfurase family protein [Thermodesulfobacteriota bacterium]
MRRIYLDYCSTTPVREEVLESILPFFTKHSGNPSSSHHFGREAALALQESREKIACCINAHSDEIIFTSGGTEANNLAIRGVIRAHQKKGRHVIVSRIEHKSVLETCNNLEKEDISATYIPVDKNGVISLKELEDSIRNDSVLISVMLANNETGVIQPVKEIAKIAKENNIILHCDAVQAAGKIPVDVKDLGIDLLSISGHKLYAPKGIGALYIKNGINIKPLFTGGHQEKGVRAGTENIPGIVGLCKALELAKEEMDYQGKRLKNLRDGFENSLQSKISGININGSGADRLPHVSNIGFYGVEAEAVMLHLEEKGIAVSSGSACTTGSPEYSHVLRAMQVPPEIGHGSIRFSLGRETDVEDINYTVTVLEETVEKLRELSPVFKNYENKSKFPRNR